MRTIAGYLPVRGEIDTRPAMMSLAGLGFRLAVPVIEHEHAPLVFHTWTPRSPVTRGRFGVPVPVDGAVVEPDVLIVPVLAFDRAGHRLGYGGGYYDRTLAALRAKGGITAIGFAFAGQGMLLIPGLQPHDMVLDAVVTERGVHRPHEATLYS